MTLWLCGWRTRLYSRTSPQNWLALLGAIVLLVDLPAGHSGFAADYWKRHTIDDSFRGADGVRFEDANRDGLLDLVTGWEQGGVVRLALHPGTSRVRDKWPSVTVGAVADPEDAVMADLDGDGWVDVISSCEGNTRSVFVHWSPGDAQKLLDQSAWKTEPLPVSRGRAQWMYCLPLQVDGRNGVDLVCGAKGEGAEVGWFQAPPDARKITEWKWHPMTPAGWVMSLIGRDMDLDGDPDIVLTDRKGPRTGCFWLENPGPGLQEGPWKRREIGGLGREVMFAALLEQRNLSGLAGVVTSAKEREVLLLLRESPNPEGWRTVAIPFPGSTGRAKGINVADINLDGRSDLVVSCESAGGRWSGVFWMSFRASFEDTAWDFHDISGPAGKKFDQVELRDLDADGDLDVVTTEEVENLGVIWYENPARNGFHRASLR